MRNLLATVLFLLLSCNCQGSNNHDIVTHSELEDRDRDYLHHKIQTFFSDGGDITTLPVHSRSRRQSQSCLDVLEEQILYKFQYEDSDGELSTALIPLVRLDVTGVKYKVDLDHITITNSSQTELLNVTLIPAQRCKHDDPDLIEYIKTLMVHPDGEPLNFSAPVVHEGEAGLPLHVDDLVFGGKLKNGFFVEAGSLDGEITSNTLHFELSHGWSGLLVEAHPIFYGQGLRKHRNVTSIMTCLGIEDKPHFMDFDLKASVRDISMAGLVPEPTETSVNIQCFPLYSLLLAMDNPTVHYFSLDIEGAELGVLKTIPWSKVDIWVVSVETHMAGQVFPGTREDIIHYMKSVGYRLMDINNEKRLKDDLFVREDVPLSESIESIESIESDTVRSEL